MRIDPRRPATPDQEQRAADQQGDAQPESGIVTGTDEAQHHRPGQLAQRITGAVQRHQPATPLFQRQLVDPALAENEHHGQLHADQQTQQQPHRITLQ
ncbi:hypothetical protein D3C78_1521580 [compost metagenome]